jgi:hypothetical protein
MVRPTRPGQLGRAENEQLQCLNKPLIQSMQPMFRRITAASCIRGHVLQAKIYCFDNYLRSSISDIGLSDRRLMRSILENRQMYVQQFLGYQGLGPLPRRTFHNFNALSRQLSYNSEKHEEIDDNMCWGFRKREEILALLESEHQIAWQLVSNSTSASFLTISSFELANTAVLLSLANFTAHTRT